MIKAVNIFLSRYWGQKHTTGFYVEIGAYDGKSKNSTLSLEKSGWEGICIEAHPERFKLLNSKRKCKCLNIAIFNKNGYVDFAIMPEKKKGWDGIIETLGKEAKKYLSDCKIIKVPSKTWNNLNLPINIDYLQIDVEGAELEILKQIDFQEYNISYICIEDNRFYHSVGKDLTYRNFLESQGYVHLEQVGVDHIYKKVISNN